MSSRLIVRSMLPACVITRAKPAVEIRIETTIRMETIVRILMRRISSRKSIVGKRRT